MARFRPSPGDLLDLATPTKQPVRNDPWQFTQTRFRIPWYS